MDTYGHPWTPVVLIPIATTKQESMGVLLGGVAISISVQKTYFKMRSKVLCFKHHKYSRMSGLVHVIFFFGR